MKSKKGWSKEVSTQSNQEDSFLRQQANIQEKKNWIVISQKVNVLFKNKIRTAKQCRQRFINHASIQQNKQNPSYSQGIQMQKLCEIFEKLGPRWSLIAAQLNGTSQNLVKNKFYGQVRKFVRRINKMIQKNKGKKCKKLNEESVFRILNSPVTIKTFNQQFKAKAQEIKIKIFKALNATNLSIEYVISLIETINIFSRDSRSYKQERNKILKHRSIKKDPKYQEQIKNETGNKQKVLILQNHENQVEFNQRKMNSQEQISLFRSIDDDPLLKISSKVGKQKKQGEKQPKNWLVSLLDEDVICQKVNQQKLRHNKQVEFEMQYDLNNKILQEFQWY